LFNLLYILGSDKKITSELLTQNSTEAYNRPPQGPRYASHWFSVQHGPLSNQTK